jgi:hypothetical protein
MASFDTLIRIDTLIFWSSAGSTRQIIDMEVKIQHEYTNNIGGELKESY